MIPPLWYAVPRLLLFIVPVFIKIKVKGKDDDPPDECEPSSKSEGEDT